MAARIGTHPSADTLQAFGLSKLDDARAETVVAHLETCADCRQVVTSQSGDDFLARLRVAHGGSQSPATAGSLSGASQHTLPPSPPSAVVNLPPELAANQQYEIIRELGRGGMGVVYLARNRLLARQEVLKVVNQDTLARAGGKERFLREIQAAAMLSHPHVVTAYAAIQVGDMLVFAMEYVEGEDLAKFVKANGPLPVANACYYAHQVALGLQHAADKKMVHRDIKPQNLILAREGKKHVVKILDFGLAKVLREHKEESDLTGAGKMLGTPDYAAPEQTLDAASADIRADIYSLGCTLYYLLTGGAPFKGTSLFAVLQAHHTEEARAVHLVRPEVPAPLAAVIQKMMAKDPAQRYQQPSEVALALAPFLQAVGKPAGASIAVAGRMAGLKKAVGQETVGPAPYKPETMTEGTAPIIQGKRKTGLKGAPSPKRKATKRGFGVGLGVGGLLLAALVGLWVGGVFRVQTKDGVLVVQVNEPNADVYVDGEKVTVTWGADGKKAEIRVKPGTRQVSVKKDGFVAYGEKVTLDDGGRRVIEATLERTPVRVGKAPQPQGSPAKTELALPARKENTLLPPTPHRPGWVEVRWLREVAALPAAQQVAAVKAMLPQRNPGFEGTVQPRLDNGVVTEIQIDGTAVQDLSPLLVFAGLQTLDCSCKDPWQSPLVDLSPLARLPLRSLRYPYHTWLRAEQLRSIKTLKTINDHPAAAFWTKVDGEAAEFEIFRRLLAGLTPEGQVRAVADRLKERNPGFDGKVERRIEKSVVVELKLPTDAVVDISPVRALPGLERLGLQPSNYQKSKLADLTPLQGMRLTSLSLSGCVHVADLTPLKGLPLSRLDVQCFQVRDLTPLQGMPLTALNVSGIRDLTPLRGMPLTFLGIHSSFQMRDLTPLTGMKLTSLDVWNCGLVQDLTPLQGMPLTSLNFIGDGCQVRDLTPLKGMPLTFLSVGGSELRDLTPLRGMKLTHLRLYNSPQMRDLISLQGMPLTTLNLSVGGQVQDLTPLHGMTLKVFLFIPKYITKGIEGIREMKSLNKVGISEDSKQQFPPAEFWKKYDAGEFKK